MSYSKIAAALGLDAAASEDDILAAIAQMAMPGKAMTAAAAALGLAETATGDEIVAAATSLAAAVANPDPAQFVPAATHQAAVDRLAELETARREQLVAAATAEGKLTPAQADWARGYLQKDEAGFLAWAAAAPVIVKPGELPAGKVGGKSAEELIAAANEHIAAEAAKGITVAPDVAVRHILSTSQGA